MSGRISLRRIVLLAICCMVLMASFGLAFYLGGKVEEGLDETNKQIDQVNIGAVEPGPEFKGKVTKGRGSGWSEVISEGLFPMTKNEEVGKKEW